MSANADWLERSRRAVWHPCTQMKAHETLPLVPIARGEGAWLYDFDGRRYLDAVSSWWVNLFGHANPRINAALAAQLGELEHVILAGFTHRPVVLLSERLAALAPRGLGHAFYGSDGASATEIALKMAFHYWKNRGQPEKTGFVSLAGSYHGETLGALAVTDVPLFRDTYAPLLKRNATVPSPDARAAAPGESARDVAARAAQALDAHLAQHHATTAALIVEPLVQGASGMAMHDPHYLAQARELCTRHGVLLIADEIMTGFGRTGTLFACEQAGIVPDFLCLSKGITGGYLPLSVRADDGRRLRRVLRRRHGARLPALALVHRQRAGLPRRARGARHLSRRRRAGREPGEGGAVDGARRPARRASRGPRLPPLRNDLGLRSRHGSRRLRAAGASPRGSRASSCCGRSAAPSTSCRRTS